MYSEPSSPDPLNACTFCGRQQLPEDEFNHIKNTLHHLTLPELENRGFCCVCLNEQNILWQLITDHDDIFQTHIVGKLAGADLKFLNQANSESREALKRSKRVATVPEKFNGAWRCVNISSRRPYFFSPRVSLLTFSLSRLSFKAARKF